MTHQCQLCSSRPSVTLVQIANGSPVAVCFECAPGHHDGATRQSKPESKLSQPREPRSALNRTVTPGIAVRTTVAPTAAPARPNVLPLRIGYSSCPKCGESVRDDSTGLHLLSCRPANDQARSVHVPTHRLHFHSAASRRMGHS